MSAGCERRRLAAIVSADAAGYSRLMGNDEVATLTALRAHRSEVIDPVIATHRGRIFKTTGDGVMAEFASVVDAAHCIVEMQRRMQGRSDAIPAEQRLQFRIGLHLGDVILDGDDVFGDGVNIAARLQAIAPAGGACLSDEAARQVRGKLGVELRRLGTQRLKNIAEPVITWCWHPDAALMYAFTSDATLNDRPAVAVLPFLNLTSTDDGDYFADGLTEDIITQLSRVSGLHITARSSAFAWKGRTVGAREIGRELGVRYLVEGSVRRADNRVRVTAQLVDAESGKQLWAERYDREVSDIFQLQDDVTAAIVGTLPGRLEAADLVRVARKLPADLAAYDYLLRGKIHHHRGTREDNLHAMDALERAVALDPGLASAHAWRGCTIGQAVSRGWVANPAAALAATIAALNTALAIDENEIEAHRILCEIRMMRREWDAAEHHHGRALGLCPNDARIVAQHGELALWQGNTTEAIDWTERAMLLDPYEAERRARLLGRALYAARRYADAVRALRRVPAPDQRALADLAAACAQAGLSEEAGCVTAALFHSQPGFSSRAYVESLTFRRDEDRRHLLEGLQKAGLAD